ncbi:MAG: exodeoxyribonuclease VII small subunit [Planctomycetaceae bacterium]|nr:exodeoxyribonuclease VII small subunit [Planctomycetaceae bacterium]|tara:strand:- start:298 stop:657 length:360 start_codon:yes stop_codon:yes gene_type:complete
MAKPKKSKPTTTFEEALEDLRTIVHDLETGQLGLSESLERYEAGIKGLKQCHQILEETERKIELLSGFDAEGNPIKQPFDELEKPTEQEKKKGSRRRKNKKSSTQSTPLDEVDDSGTLF